MSAAAAAAAAAAAGNPTGQCLSYDNLKELIKFAYDEKIVLMADEVRRQEDQTSKH
jgi:aspartate/methionine/tyrosine aminotransferase